MYPRTSLIARASVAAFVAASAFALPASAGTRDKAFFEQVTGGWSGKGEIVAGIKGFEFEVMQADPHHIRRVKIKRLKQRAAREAIAG